MLCMPNDWRIVLMLYNEDILIENIMKKGNKVLIWGACERNNDILEFFRQNDVNVVGYIDQNADEQNTCNDLPVYNKDVIRSDSYFVYVGLLKTYDEVISHLESNNYREFADYWYPNREIKLDGSCGYKDLYGNEYIGEKYSIDITLKNCGKLYIGQNCNFKGSIEISVSNRSEVKIEDKTKINGKYIRIRCNLESTIYLGESCRFDETFSRDEIIVWCKSKLEIKSKAVFMGLCKFFCSYSSEIILNKNFRANDNLFMSSSCNSSIIIEEDSGISSDTIVRAGSGHNIFDFEAPKNLHAAGRSVRIGKHVWIGQRVILFNGCDIGSGSIVGINTFVNKKFPNNCSIAGNPARIIKENIAWRIESSPYFEEYKDFAEFDFR